MRVGGPRGGLACALSIKERSIKERGEGQVVEDDGKRAFRPIDVGIHTR